MSKQFDIGNDVDLTDDDFMDDNDYAFIIGPTGELKVLFVPEQQPGTHPENISAILKIFGLTDAAIVSAQVNNATMH